MEGKGAAMHCLAFPVHDLWSVPTSRVNLDMSDFEQLQRGDRAPAGISCHPLMKSLYPDVQSGVWKGITSCPQPRSWTNESLSSGSR